MNTQFFYRKCGKTPHPSPSPVRRTVLRGLHRFLPMGEGVLFKPFSRWEKGWDEGLLTLKFCILRRQDFRRDARATLLLADWAALAKVTTQTSIPARGEETLNQGSIRIRPKPISRKGASHDYHVFTAQG